MLHLNINHNVSVELTPLGLQHLKDTRAFEVQGSVDGMIYRTQLWCLMRNFPQPYMAGPVYYKHSISFEDTAVTKSIPEGRDIEIERACTTFLNGWFGSDSAHAIRMSKTYEQDKYPGYKTIFHDGIPVIIYKKNFRSNDYSVVYFCCETEKESKRRKMTLKQIQDKLRNRGKILKKKCDASGK